MFDDRLSFKFVTTITTTAVQVDQPAGNIRDFEFLALVDHNLAGGNAVVKTYPTVNRVTPTTVTSENISSDDPMLLDLGSVQSGKQFIDVELTASGSNTMTLGELALLTKFDSPKAPSVNVPTRVNPNRTFIPLPNGERRSIQHGQPVRLKSYRITGLTQAEAQSWLDVYNANEGIRLVIVSDDEDDTYPGLMNTELPKSRELDNFTVDLEFQEIKL